MTPAYIDASIINAAYRRALRTGAFWRLRPEERAILRLSSRLARVKSPLLAGLLLEIICRVWPSMARRLRALELGMRVLEERVRQALHLGYYQALEWLKDFGLALQIGYSLLNTPKAYWPVDVG